MVDSMKKRLQDTLQDHKELELEYIALKKNFFTLQEQQKNMDNRSARGGQQQANSDLQARFRVMEADHKVAINRKEREIQTLLEEHKDATLARTQIEQLKHELKNCQDDKSTIQTQHIELQETYLKDMKKYEKGAGIENIPQDYLAQKDRVEKNLTQLLERKDKQNGALHAQLLALKKYARELKIRLTHLYTEKREPMPEHLIMEPINVSAQEEIKRMNYDTLIETYQGRCNILETEIGMMKQGNMSVNDLARIGDDKVQILNDQVKQFLVAKEEMETSLANLQKEWGEEGLKAHNVVRAKEQ